MILSYSGDAGNRRRRYCTASRSAAWPNATRPTATAYGNAKQVGASFNLFKCRLRILAEYLYIKEVSIGYSFVSNMNL